MIRSQELTFKCERCQANLTYDQDRCNGCNSVLEWADIHLTYADKYIDIYEIHIQEV
jgi:hypothetical protein